MEEEKNFDYKNEPGLKLKKELSENDGEALISIVTPYYNSKKYIKQTAYSILNQTFPYWEWIIMNDGSTEEGTKEILEELSKLDNRIKIYNEENKGRIIARDNAIKESTTDLIFTIDSDDLIDETVLECSYWTLKTNPEATWVYSDMANFDGKQFLWRKIFDSEVEKKENILPVCSLIIKSAILEIGGYGVVDKDVHEDWHLWLRMLEKGYFPIRMNYYGYWYRQKKEGGVLASINGDKERDLHARKVIKEQADKVKDRVAAIQFPTTADANYDTYPYVFDWNRKSINGKLNKKHLLFIFPWFKIGGADKFNYDLIAGLDKEIYDVTIITTEPSEYVWRNKFEKYATIFDLTSFLQRKDWASFMHYIIKSRNIDLVMESNSFYGYYALPWLKSEFPKVVFTDYIHSQNWNWRNGEYPRESTAISRILDKTYTCTKFVGNVMKNQMGRTNENMETVYIGVDFDEFNPKKVNIDKYEQIVKYKQKYEGKKKILFLARISEEKRPIFIVRVLEDLCKKRNDVMLLVVGDGPELAEMKKTVEKLNLQDNVIFFGMQNDAKPFYKLADVEVISSLTEGLTLTTYESMSMETPVVTANVGGQKELVDNYCGRVVENIQNAKNDFYNRAYTAEEIKRYSDAIIEILDNPEYEKISKECREKVKNGYSINDMVKFFNKEFKDLIDNGTVVEDNVVVQNNELYKQYLVMFNQVDKRFYNSTKGGINVEIHTHEAEFEHMKDKLWANPLWRGFIKFLQKTKIMKLAKDNGLDTKIKEKIKNKM